MNENRNFSLLFQDISTESEEFDDYDPKAYVEKGETESSEKRVTRSMAKEKAEETSLMGKMTGLAVNAVKAVFGQQQKPEEEEKEPRDDNIATEETAEAIFESVRDCQRPDEITVRLGIRSLIVSFF